MKELYWIERMDGFVVAEFFLLAIVVAYLVVMTVVDTETKETFEIRKLPIVAVFILAFALVFTPSTKEMYRIVGIGGVIDYLQQNETAKQIPDKCIRALDILLEDPISNKPDSEMFEQENKKSGIYKK